MIDNERSKPPADDDSTVARAGESEILAAGSNATLGSRPQVAGTDTDEPVIGTGATLKGRYLLERRIGEGGMGLVFQARDVEEERIARLHGRTDTRHLLAIKVLRPQFLEYGRLVIEEVIRTRELVHENIVRAGDCQQDGNVLFMTMEFMEGRTLEASLNQDFAQGMPWNLARLVIEGLGDGLGFAHDHGVVHCDFKPSNVFLTPSLSPKILDFGIANAIRGGSSKVTVPAGLTPRYASPEMVQAWESNGSVHYEPDPRDDIFALAVVVYEILTARHPFGNEFENAERARAMGFVCPAIPQLSSEQNAALARAMCFERPNRTPKVEQFVEAFLPRDGAILRRTDGSISRPTVAIAIAVLAVAACAWWYLSSRDAQVRPSRPHSVAAVGRIAQPETARLAARLGTILDTPEDNRARTDEELRAAIRSASRRVVLGSTDEEIQAAVSLCRRYRVDCAIEWYADEQKRETTLQAFDLDLLPVSVQDFTTFVQSTGHRTAAERYGAFRYTQQGLKPERNGTWRNGVTFLKAQPQWAVVGVDFEDARAYCEWKGRRLPSEDEWEYATRGIERTLFGWGNDPDLRSLANQQVPPDVGSGPAEGIGGRFRNLSASVWEWVDTDHLALNRTGNLVPGKIRKGGSWRETNMANNRAAVRRYSATDMPDDVSGFRCAKTTSQWPDAEEWLGHLP